MNHRNRLLTLISIVGLVLMWGLSWSILKIGLHYIPPMLFVGLRTLGGGIILTLVALPRWRLLNFRKAWHIYVISGILNVVLFFGLQTLSLQVLPSGLVSVLVYLSPILVGVFAWLWLGETMTPRKITGLLIGFAGVSSISIEGISTHVSGIGVLYGLLAAVSWALGTVYMKRTQAKVELFWLVAMQFLFGGVLTTALGFSFERWSAIHWTLPFWLSMGYSSAIGVALSWVTWIYLLRLGEASRVSAMTFLVPLLSVAIGTVFLHEPASFSLLVGLVLISVSIYLVNRTKTVPRRGARELDQPVEPIGL